MILKTFTIPSGLPFLHRALLIMVCLSALFVVRLNGQQLYRRHLSLPAGEMWIESTHRTTLDGGTVVLYETADNTSNYYLNLVKTTANGNIQWSTRWACDHAPAFKEIGLTPDSGFILCYTDLNPTHWYLILRFDAGGSMIHSKQVNVTAPYSVMNSAPQIIAKGNGNCYIVGFLKDYSSPFPHKHLLHVFELDSSCNVLWSRAYNEDNTAIKSYRIGADTCANGDLVIVGYHYDTSTSQSCPRITRLTPTGTLVWSKYYSVSGSSNTPLSLVVARGDEIVVASEAITTSAIFNLMRCDGQGNLLWNYEIASLSPSPSPSPLHIGYGNGNLMEAENNTTVIWGPTGYGSVMVKNDSAGVVLCQSYYPDVIIRSSGDVLQGQRYSAIGVNLVGVNYVLFSTGTCGQACNASTFTTGTTSLTTTVVSLRSDTLMPVIESPAVITLLPSSDSILEICTDFVGDLELVRGQVTIYPVPSADQIRIESDAALECAELIDVQGKIVLTENLQGTNSAFIELPVVPNGIYLLRLSLSDGTVMQQKILIHQDQ